MGNNVDRQDYIEYWKSIDDPARYFGQLPSEDPTFEPVGYSSNSWDVETVSACFFDFGVEVTNNLMTYTNYLKKTQVLSTEGPVKETNTYEVTDVSTNTAFHHIYPTNDIWSGVEIDTFDEPDGVDGFPQVAIIGSPISVVVFTIDYGYSSVGGYGGYNLLLQDQYVDVDWAPVAGADEYQVYLTISHYGGPTIYKKSTNGTHIEFHAGDLYPGDPGGPIWTNYPASPIPMQLPVTNHYSVTGRVDATAYVLTNAIVPFTQDYYVEPFISHCDGDNVVEEPAPEVTHWWGVSNTVDRHMASVSNIVASTNFYLSTNEFGHVWTSLFETVTTYDGNLYRWRHGRWLPSVYGDDQSPLEDEHSIANIIAFPDGLPVIVDGEIVTGIGSLFIWSEDAVYSNDAYASGVSTGRAIDRPYQWTATLKVDDVWNGSVTNVPSPITPYRVGDIFGKWTYGYDQYFEK